MKHDFRMILSAVFCLFFCFGCMDAQAAGEEQIQVETRPHAAQFSFALAEQEYVYVKYTASNDSGEMVLYSQDGHFTGECFLPGTDQEETLRITVYTLKGGRLLDYNGPTAADESEKAPAAGLDETVRAAGSASNAVFAMELDGVHYSFDLPGRDSVRLRCKSPQEMHSVLLYAQEGYHYEGVMPMPLTYAEDRVTVTVLTANSNAPLHQEMFYAPMAAPEVTERNENGRLNGVLVCIDPGHQRKTQVETVPLGPNFKKQSTTTVGMAQGIISNRREAIVVLEVAMKLRNALLAEGAQVIMTREEQDVFVGMLERANIPNDAGADFVLRLHCNSRDDENVQGIQIYCPYQSSYAAEVTDEDTYRAMGFALLDAMKAATGAIRGTCTLNNNYVGNNWSKMPSFLVEMGYLTNREEDLKMATEHYQQLLAQGMTEGVYQLSLMRGLIKE